VNSRRRDLIPSIAALPRVVLSINWTLEIPQPNTTEPEENLPVENYILMNEHVTTARYYQKRTTHERYDMPIDFATLQRVNQMPLESKQCTCRILRASAASSSPT